MNSHRETEMSETELYHLLLMEEEEFGENSHPLSLLTELTEFELYDPFMELEDCNPFVESDTSSYSKFRFADAVKRGDGATVSFILSQFPDKVNDSLDEV